MHQRRQLPGKAFRLPVPRQREPNAAPASSPQYSPIGAILAHRQGPSYQHPMSEDIRHILDRLRERPDNPVVRARRMVEAYVPEDRRGPGWDRHWRELQAYLEVPGRWIGGEKSEDDV